MKKELKRLADMRWNGYEREDGRIGIRNIVLIIYTVECAKHVAYRIAECEGNDVHVIGFPGCYDNQYAVRLLLALARNPNVGAILSVGLGCEYTRPADIARVVRESGRPAEWFYIQETGGTIGSIERGKEIVDRLRNEVRQTKRREMGIPDLVLGAECGGSDSTSGLAANPVVGGCFDLLVDAGGTAVWEETVEMLGLKPQLVARAASAEASVEIARAYDKAEEYCREVRQYSVSPGNFAGGLTTIEEKSLGSYAKSGSKRIQGVLKVAEPVSRPGLWLLDSVPDPHFMQFGYTNPNDTEGLMDLLSAGCHILFYTTGRGSCTGSPIGPTIKVTGNSATYRKLKDDMDFDAGRVLTGEISREEVSMELLELVAKVAAGAETKPESLGHREYFIPYKHQSTPSLAEGCRA